MQIPKSESKKFSILCTFKGVTFLGGVEIKDSHLSDEGKAMLNTKNVVKLGICSCNLLQIEWVSRHEYWQAINKAVETVNAQ